MIPAVLKSWDDKQAGGMCIHLCEPDKGTRVQSHATGSDSWCKCDFTPGFCISCSLKLTMGSQNLG